MLSAGDAESGEGSHKLHATAAYDMFSFPLFFHHQVRKHLNAAADAGRYALQQPKENVREIRRKT